MNATYLPINIDEIPVRKIFTIGGVDLDFEFQVNDGKDLFTVIVRDLNANVLFSSNIVYGNPVNHVVVSGFPIGIEIIPASIDDLYKDQINDIQINESNFGSSVNLFVGASQ